MTVEMNSSLKGIHDRLLAEKPDDAVHDPNSCPLCAMGDDGGSDGGSVVSDQTYSKAELDAAVDKAVSEKTAVLEAQVTDLQAAAQTSEVDAAVSQVKAEAAEQIADLQRQLDDKVLEAANVTAEKDAIITWLDSEASAAEQTKVVEARREERLTKVKEVASFPEEYLTANADRFAAMSDEDFQVALDGWAAISGKNTGGTLPPTTGLHAGRESDLAGRSSGSSVKEMFELRRQRGRLDYSTL
jgi:hypothetical protein